MKLHIVSLPAKEKKSLSSIITTGTHPARVFVRAQILLKAHKGLKDEHIAEHLDCSVRTVAQVRKHYCTEGLKRALHDATRSGRPRTFNDKQRAKVVALACTAAPTGRSYWTLDLLVDEAAKEGAPMKRNKIWTVLKENELKPWRKKNVVHSKAQR
jgi:transposase